MACCDKCCERGKSRGFGSPEKETLALHLQGCSSSTVPLENGMAGKESRQSLVDVSIICRFVYMQRDREFA